MDTDFLNALDEYFCANYSDYVRLSALEGYEMPEVVYVSRDGNIVGRDPSCMRLEKQAHRETLLKKLKSELKDTNFTFSFTFRPLGDRIRDPFRKHTFAKLLPVVLKRYGETTESVGAKLDIEPRFWRMIVKGKLYPEKNTLIALALVSHMQQRDLNNLMNICGLSFANDNVRDVVVQYLVTQKIYNAAMRDRCLAEYSITNLPIRREGGQ